MPPKLFTRISAKLTAMSAAAILMVAILLVAVWVGGHLGRQELRFRPDAIGHFP